MAASKTIRDAVWMKNVLVDWFKSSEYPYRKATEPFTEDNYTHFKECFIATRAIAWNGKTKNYNADLVADLNGDQYLVDLKKWLDSGRATNVTDVTPRKPGPSRVSAVPVPAQVVAPADGGKAAGHGHGSIPMPLPKGYPQASSGEVVPKDLYERTERARAWLHGERERRNAELQTTQEQLEEARRALQLANDKEAQRMRFAAESRRKAEEELAATKEAQRKAAEQAKLDEERAFLLAKKTELDKEIAEYNAKNRAQATTQSTPVSSLGKRDREPDAAAPPSKTAKSETDPVTIMSAFGVTVGAVAMGVAISPTIPAALTAAALTWVVKAKLDAAKKQ